MRHLIVRAGQLPGKSLTSIRTRAAPRYIRPHSCRSRSSFSRPSQDGHQMKMESEGAAAAAAAAAEPKFQLFTSLRYDPALVAVPDLDMPVAGWNHRVASPFYMLDFHRDRMLRAAAHWGWEGAAGAIAGDEGLERLARFLAEQSGGLEQPAAPHRFKVILDGDGRLGLESGPVPAKELRNLFPERLPRPGESLTADEHDEARNLPSRASRYEVLVDASGTARSAFTHYKTTNRAMYDVARARSLISRPESQEVLLVNDADGAVMEGSTTTPYFWRGGRWVTPPVSKTFGPGGRDSGGQDGTTRRWALERNIAVEEAVLGSTLVDGEECWISNGVRGFMFGNVKLAQ